jgi:hypothetical protein
MITLWRNSPPQTALFSSVNKGTTLKQEYIFPSGRQGLTAGLKYLGLGRSNRVALPEWSSACVINAVGKVATPVPMAEVVKYGIKVDAVLLYEQWGWPILAECKKAIAERFKDAIIILDRIDSADIDNDNRIKFYPQNNQIDLISLSKLLGLKGGGLVKINGEYVEFKGNIIDEKICGYLWRKMADDDVEDKLLHMHKNDVGGLQKDLREWLEANSLMDAIEQEGLRRRENLSCVIGSLLSRSWPDWIGVSFERGVCPGIVPLFRGESREELTSKKAAVAGRFGIETEVYHFDWAGSPLRPEYGFCLAFPIHGEVAEMELLVKKLVKLQ